MKILVCILIEKRTGKEGIGMKRTKIAAVVVLLLAVSTCLAGNSLNMEWEALFDGKSLDGWVQRNGNARYEVEDGMIVGTSVKGEPNSFLCTEEHYGNFVLELEFLVDEDMNSGVQIRSNSTEEYRNGRVHGYQVEIDPSDRAWTAGIYDEARRGWLYDLRHNQAAREAFKQGDWNHLRVEAIDDHIRTWLNGVPAAHLVDGMTRSGFIALQVHSRPTSGIQVRWRNIRILDLGTTTEFPQIIHGHSQ